jgi:uncharacterized protein
LGEVSLRPLDPAARINEIDVVRGFALFGVLLLNMYGFGADSTAWNSTIDRLAFTVTHVFFDSKSWTLFSLLFGFGFFLQTRRIHAQGLPIWPACLRRLFALFAIGAANMLLHNGDILMIYAQLGLVLLLLHRLPTKWLLLLSIALLMVFPLSHLATPDRSSFEWEPGETAIDARAELESERLTSIYATGSFTDILVYNAPEIPPNPFADYNWPDSGLAVLSMFLLGLLIGRSGILADIPGHVRTIVRVRAWGLGLGFACMAVEQVLTARAGYAVFRPASAEPGIVLAGDLLFTFGTVALALGYAAALILAARTRKGRTLLSPLGAAGRMALTVYLTQTLIFTTLFHGYAFGAAFRLGPAAVSASAVIIFAVQVLACQWWLRRYRFGPAEWLLRSFAYREWQPLRRTA